MIEGQITAMLNEHKAQGNFAEIIIRDAWVDNQ